jgi:hypothetical protein
MASLKAKFWKHHTANSVKAEQNLVMVQFDLQVALTGRGKTPPSRHSEPRFHDPRGGADIVLYVCATLIIALRPK